MEDFKIIFKKDIANNIASSPRWYWGIAGAVVVAAFGLGIFFGRSFFNNNATHSVANASSTTVINGLGGATKIKNVNFNLYWEVWNKLQERYVHKPVADADLFYKSLEGLVAAAGDPYTVFFRPEDAERFNQDLSGSFSGIGAEMGMKKEIITIIAPLPDSPAERAGLKAGDLVLAVNGEETYGWTVDEAVNKIRGEKGTVVKLLVSNSDGSSAKEVSIVRDTIIVKSVKWEMKGQVAYIQISSFNEDTADLFDQAIKELVPKNPEAFILDLRNNPGGFLDTGVRVASEWIEEGTIVIEKFSDGTEDKYVSNGKHRLANFKTFVLVNGGSASAAEIVAGSLQDYGKATIVGEKTFGKGSVQDYEQLSDGSGLKITVAEWLTPKGRHIDKNGVVPDTKIAAETVTSTIQVVEEVGDKDTVLEKLLKTLK